MFNPSREQARDVFFDAWRKYRAGLPLAGIENLVIDVILLHPEYHALLGQPERSREKAYEGESNPFLHLSLHLAFEEQLLIDQPSGVRETFNKILKTRDRHAALHEAVECLAEMMWRAQRDAAPPDASAYLDCLGRRAR